MVELFDVLTGLLGLYEFCRIFPVILTDNGSEFKHTRELETTEAGKKRTKVFYCDPQASRQKPQIEKNHEFTLCSAEGQNAKSVYAREYYSADEQHKQYSPGIARQQVAL